MKFCRRLVNNASTIKYDKFVKITFDLAPSLTSVCAYRTDQHNIWYPLNEISPIAGRCFGRKSAACSGAWAGRINRAAMSKYEKTWDKKTNLEKTDLKWGKDED